MKRTIGLTPKATTWILIINGIANCVIGIQIIHPGHAINWGSLPGIVLILIGSSVAIYGMIIFSPANKLTPKVQVDGSGIMIKEDFYKRQIKIAWNNVREITYKSFELDFLLIDETRQVVELKTNAEISISIKKTVRQFADDRQIKIIGG